MKLFVLVELGYSYNDEYHSPHEDDSGQPVKAYRVKANADDACKVMNAERVAKEQSGRYGMLDGDGEQITEFFRVAEIEVADADVESYASARESLRFATERAKTAAQKEFGEQAAKLFDAHSGLESFGWNQYTPYFNDGDEPRFGVRDEESDINGKDGGGLDSGRRYGPVPGYQRLPDQQPSAEYLLQEHVAKFLSGFDKDHMKAMFGDHVTVTVTRPGTVDVSDCSHD